MTEDQKFYLVITFVVVAIIVIARFPGILIAFIGKSTARCRDGSLSYSAHRCGTCSHHGGVDEFLPA